LQESEKGHGKLRVLEKPEDRIVGYFWYENGGSDPTNEDFGSSSCRFDAYLFSMSPELLQLLQLLISDSRFLPPMKFASTLTLFLCAFIFPGFPVAAQEHVDVPLPAYDPPPAASHHSETRDDQPPRVSRPSHSAPKVSRPVRSTSTAPRSHAPAKKRKVTSSRQHQSHPSHHTRHRRHRFFHWPWQHH
jgi:hypothetical protein